MTGARWDERLITRGEAADLAGEIPVSWDLIPGDGAWLILRCLDHEIPQSCGQWIAGRPTTLDDMISGILRHRVTAHDQPLNRPARQKGNHDGNNRNDPAGGRGRGGPGPEGGAGLPDPPGPGPGGPGGHRPGDKTGDPGRVQGTTGGDQA